MIENHSYFINLRMSYVQDWYSNLKKQSLTHRLRSGQIHMEEPGTTKPVCQLYYNDAGVIQMGVSQTRQGDQVRFDVGNVPVGRQWS